MLTLHSTQRTLKVVLVAHPLIDGTINTLSGIRVGRLRTDTSPSEIRHMLNQDQSVSLIRMAERRLRAMRVDTVMEVLLPLIGFRLPINRNRFNNDCRPFNSNPFIFHIQLES